MFQTAIERTVCSDLSGFSSFLLLSMSLSRALVLVDEENEELRGSVMSNKSIVSTSYDWARASRGSEDEAKPESV